MHEAHKRFRHIVVVLGGCNPVVSVIVGHHGINDALAEERLQVAYPIFVIVPELTLHSALCGSHDFPYVLEQDRSRGTDAPKLPTALDRARNKEEKNQ